MRIVERKVVTVEMEAYEYAMLVDILEAAKKVRSKKWPTLNKMAEDLLTCLDGATKGVVTHAPS